jgi:hypothetical protein
MFSDLVVELSECTSPGGVVGGISKATRFEMTTINNQCRWRHEWGGYNAFPPALVTRSVRYGPPVNTYRQSSRRMKPSKRQPGRGNKLCITFPSGFIGFFSMAMTLISTRRDLLRMIDSTMICVVSDTAIVRLYSRST